MFKKEVGPNSGGGPGTFNRGGTIINSVEVRNLRCEKKKIEAMLFHVESIPVYNWKKALIHLTYVIRNCLTRYVKKYAHLYCQKQGFIQVAK